ncbi:MAG: adenylate/guanylate cyclase domain-containing protein [Cyanobacteriota bacterium SKYGB_h_bin112]|nr:adenylate/guanylate cyclase domain-containing protein [Cyanobacteriota bacterium SKYGB_h_bin112]
MQVLIVVSAVGWLSFRGGQQAVNALASRLQQETSHRITQELTTYLARPVTVNKMNLDAIQIGLVDVQNSTQLEQLFWRELRTHKVSLIKLGTESGRLVGVGNLVPGEDSRIFEVTPEQPAQLRVYASDRQGNRTALVQTIWERNPVYKLWYTKAVQVGRLVWSAIDQLEGYPTIPVITCSVPIYSQANKLIGVLAAELTLSDLSNFLRMVQTSSSGRTFIVDRYGLLIASSDNQPITRTIGSSVATRLRATDSSDHLIQTTAQYLSHQFPNLTAITTSQHLTFSDEGQKRFVQVTPWHDELGLDWLVINVLPESDFMGQVNAARVQTLWLSLLALGATIVIGSFTAHWIVYPIMRLSRSAEALSVGNWETPVDIWRNDEVGHLAKAFRRMAYQLRDSFALLEQRMEEQTADLASAEMMNRSLLQAIPDLIARLDDQGTYLDFKPAETFSSVVTQDEVVGFNIYDLLPLELAEQHMQGVRQALQTGTLQHREYQLLVKGDVRYEESRIVPIGSDQALVIVRDITERKQAEREMEILLTLTQDINASTDFQTALTITLKEICDVTGWLCGEAWVPTTDGQALECHPAWYLNEAVIDEQQMQALQEFRYYSEGLTLVADQGLPTQVWQQHCAIWIADIEMEPKALYLRESVASDCGLKAGAGFPILTQQGNVVAVLVFWIGHVQHYASAAMNLVNTVTAQLGTVLHNKQIEAKLSGLFAAMRDVILIFDDQGYCLEVVTTDPSLLYPLSEQQVGRYLSDVLPKEQATAFRECIWEALRTHQTTTIEYKLPIEGQDLWFSANVSPIADNRVIWVARDITHRKQAEEVLRQREADLARTSRFLDSIIETMPLAVFAKDVTQEFRYVLWNKAAEEIYGIRREQALGRTLYDLVDPELAAQLSAEHETLVEQRQLVITDEIFQSRYQREIWQRIRKLPIIDDQNQVSHLLYIAEDVTEYKRLEAELHTTNDVLRQAEEKYRSIVENAVDGIFQTTPDGRYLSANLALAKIFGYDSPEELMAAVNQLVHHLYVDKQDRDRFVSSIRITGSIANFEARVYRKDGSTIWIEENAREVRDADGKLLYYEGIVTDITRRRMAETALRLEKEKYERLLLNILPEPIVNRLKYHNDAIAESFEEVSILFADIVGFTPLSAQMQPIELVGMLNQVFSEFDRLVDQYQLEKIKTIGDAYMVAAGLPIPREDHAEAIAELALAMQAAMQNFYTAAGDPIRIRIGINSGMVVAGVIGTKKFIYDLWGDTVNVANRMESYGEPGKIQVTEATYGRLRDRYHLVQRGCIHIKGKGNMTTYWLQGRITK